jgi:hypothetical protein
MRTCLSRMVVYSRVCICGSTKALLKALLRLYKALLRVFRLYLRLYLRLYSRLYSRLFLEYICGSADLRLYLHFPLRACAHAQAPADVC